jgi:hypothetical protein
MGDDPTNNPNGTRAGAGVNINNQNDASRGAPGYGRTPVSDPMNNDDGTRKGSTVNDNQNKQLRDAIEDARLTAEALSGDIEDRRGENTLVKDGEAKGTIKTGLTGAAGFTEIDIAPVVPVETVYEKNIPDRVVNGKQFNPLTKNPDEAVPGSAPQKVVPVRTEVDTVTGLTHVVYRDATPQEIARGYAQPSLPTNTNQPTNNTVQGGAPSMPNVRTSNPGQTYSSPTGGQTPPKTSTPPQQKQTQVERSVPPVAQKGDAQKAGEKAAGQVAQSGAGAGRGATPGGPDLRTPEGQKVAQQMRESGTPRPPQQNNPAQPSQPRQQQNDPSQQQQSQQQSRPQQQQQQARQPSESPSGRFPTDSSNGGLRQEGNQRSQQQPTTPNSRVGDSRTQLPTPTLPRTENSQPTPTPTPAPSPTTPTAPTTPAPNQTPTVPQTPGGSGGGQTPTDEVSEAEPLADVPDVPLPTEQSPKPETQPKSIFTRIRELLLPPAKSPTERLVENEVPSEDIEDRRNDDYQPTPEEIANARLDGAYTLVEQPSQRTAAPKGNREEAIAEEVDAVVSGDGEDSKTAALEPIEGGAAPVKTSPKPTVAPVEFDLDGKTRNLPVSGSLVSEIRKAVGKVYGPGYKVLVVSAAQPPKGCTNCSRTGSIRHDINPKTGKGIAADVFVEAPNGKFLSGRELAPLIQHWHAVKLGSAGYYGGNMAHLDLVGGTHPEGRPLKKGEAFEWDWTEKKVRVGTKFRYVDGTGDPVIRKAMLDGRKGIKPTYAGSDSDVAETGQTKVVPSSLIQDKKALVQRAKAAATEVEERTKVIETKRMVASPLKKTIDSLDAKLKKGEIQPEAALTQLMNAAEEAQVDITFSEYDPVMNPTPYHYSVPADMIPKDMVPPESQAKLAVAQAFDATVEVGVHIPPAALTQKITEQRVVEVQNIPETSPATDLAPSVQTLSPEQQKRARFTETQWERIGSVTAGTEQEWSKAGMTEQKQQLEAAVTKLALNNPNILGKFSGSLTPQDLKNLGHTGTGEISAQTLARAIDALAPDLTTNMKPAALTSMLMSFYTDVLNMPKVEAAALAGNFAVESGGNPRAAGDKKNGVYTAAGLAQWRLDRQEALEKYAGVKFSGLKTQRISSKYTKAWYTEGPGVMTMAAFAAEEFDAMNLSFDKAKEDSLEGYTTYVTQKYEIAGIAHQGRRNAAAESALRAYDVATEAAPNRAGVEVATITPPPTPADPDPGKVRQSPQTVVTPTSITLEERETPIEIEDSPADVQEDSVPEPSAGETKKPTTELQKKIDATTPVEEEMELRIRPELLRVNPELQTLTEIPQDELKQMFAPDGYLVPGSPVEYAPVVQEPAAPRPPTGKTITDRVNPAAPVDPRASEPNIEKNTAEEPESPTDDTYTEDEIISEQQDAPVPGDDGGIVDRTVQTVTTWVTKVIPSTGTNRNDAGERSDIGTSTRR